MRDDSATGGRRKVTRRTALQVGSLGAAALLAGCTDDIGEEFPPNRIWPTAEVSPDLPITEQTDVLESRIEAMASEEIADVETFADAFDEYAFDVETVEEENDVLTIEYVNTRAYDSGKLHDIGPIAGAYAALVDGGYDAVALGITIMDVAPASYGSATVETEWAERFNAGDFSAKEYGELVAQTIESEREPPEVDVSPDE